MRVVVADPPAYTPPYDRSLCAALARAGADVELVTSRFRFGSVAEPEGYEAHEWFYPLSSRMSATRLRLAVKALEHPLGMARFALDEAGRRCTCSGSARRRLDRWLFRPRSPAVFTAHDIIPRRTLSKTAMWRALFDRFERVVVHSERGRGQLVDFGVAGEKLRVIPHPVFRSEVDRRDDGRTALCLGLIRPYKGTEDAVEAVLRVDDARLLVVGDPRVPLDGLQQTAATARSGGSDTSRTPSCGARCPRRRSGSFRTARRSTSPGRSCRCSAPACPRSSTTSAGSARSSGASVPAPSCPPATIEAMAAALAPARSRTRTRSPPLGEAPSARATSSPGTRPQPRTSSCTASSS